MGKRTFDHTVYAIIDPEKSRSGEPISDALAVAQGGASAIQIRCKNLETTEFLQTARAVIAALTGYEIPVLINDRVDVALAAGADGVHLGWQDMPISDARNILGDNALIGLSIKTSKQAQLAPVGLLDYCCIGGFFPTNSKDSNGNALGAERYHEIRSILHRRAPKMPVGAIAGIDRENVHEPISVGADGVAVISALSQSENPRLATKELRERIICARKGEPK